MPKEKYQKPVKIDLPFDEALERFAQTDPSEMLPDHGEPPDAKTGNEIVLFQSKKGKRIQARFDGETLWMTVGEVAQLFGRSVSVITRHIASIVEEGELPASNNLQKMQVNTRGRPPTLCSLDMIISVGYRVSSKEATEFRIWATSVLKEFIVKGFALDDERLAEPEARDHFAELRQRIAAIRTAEAMVYAELKRTFALCSDYDPKSPKTGAFFASVQNKLHNAITSKTAAEIIRARANADEPSMGLTSWKGDEIRLPDTKIGKNYLGQIEIDDLNRATNMLLDYFDDQAQRRRMVSMTEAETKLDDWLRFNNRPVLIGRGKVTKDEAHEHAEREFRKFEAKRLERDKADADASLVHSLNEQVKTLAASKKSKKLEKKG